jgi:hypothetical protein
VSTEIDRAAKRAAVDADHAVFWHINKARKSLSARRVKTHPKIAAVSDAIRPLLDSGEKVLVFSHHRATASELLSALERCLKAESVSRTGPPEKVWRAAWKSLLPDEDSLVTPIIDWLCTPGLFATRRFDELIARDMICFRFNADAPERCTRKLILRHCP